MPNFLFLFQNLPLPPRCFLLLRKCIWKKAKRQTALPNLIHYYYAGLVKPILIWIMSRVPNGSSSSLNCTSQHSALLFPHINKPISQGTRNHFLKRNSMGPRFDSKQLLWWLVVRYFTINRTNDWERWVSRTKNLQKEELHLFGILRITALKQITRDRNLPRQTSG